jgi:hypothetical protein
MNVLPRRLAFAPALMIGLGIVAANNLARGEPAGAAPVANSAQLDARLNGAWLEMQGSIQARLGAYLQEIAGLQKDVLSAAKDRDAARAEVATLRAQVKLLQAELAKRPAVTLTGPLTTSSPVPVKSPPKPDPDYHPQPQRLPNLAPQSLPGKR